MKKILSLLSFSAICAFSAEVVLGIAQPLTGPYAAYGQDVHKGIILANEMDAKAGEHAIKLISLDTKGDKIETQNAVTRLIANDKALGIIAEAVTPNTLQAISIAEEKKTPLIAPVASGDKLLDGKKYAARVCFMDSFQGQAFAKWAAEKLGKKAVVVHDQTNVYSIGLSKAFSTQFLGSGGTVAKKLAVVGGDKDFKALASSIKEIDPDFVYLPIYHPEAALIAKALRQVEYKKILAGGDGLGNETLIELGGEAVEGLLYTDAFDAENPPNEAGKAFVEAYKKNHNGSNPPAFSAMGADAYFVFKSAVEACQDLNKDCINDRIHNTVNLQVPGGVINIDNSGNAARTVIVKEIKDGKQKFKDFL